MPKIFFNFYLNEKIYTGEFKMYNYELDYSRIKDLRIERNLTQQDIANLLEINQSTYSKFELLKANITIEMLNKLSNFYNVSLDYLLKLTDTPDINIIKKELDKKLIGKRLKEFRKEKHLYQDTLAKNLGTGRSLISEYESGKRLISLTYGYAICKKYNISMDYLYCKI